MVHIFALSLEVQRLTDGLVRVIDDETGVYLVHRDKSERVRLSSASEPNAPATYNRRRLLSTLPSREKKVFELLGVGLDLTRIALRMGLSAKTIEIHRDSLKDKLKFERLTQLLAFALEWNLIRQISAKGLMQPTAC